MFWGGGAAAILLCFWSVFLDSYLWLRLLNISIWCGAWQTGLLLAGWSGKRGPEGHGSVASWIEVLGGGQQPTEWPSVSQLRSGSDRAKCQGFLEMACAGYHTGLGSELQDRPLECAHRTCPESQEESGRKEPESAGEFLPRVDCRSGPQLPTPAWTTLGGPEALAELSLFP